MKWLLLFLLVLCVAPGPILTVQAEEPCLEFRQQIETAAEAGESTDSAWRRFENCLSGEVYSRLPVLPPPVGYVSWQYVQTTYTENVFRKSALAVIRVAGTGALVRVYREDGWSAPAAFALAYEGAQPHYAYTSSDTVFVSVTYPGQPQILTVLAIQDGLARPAQHFGFADTAEVIISPDGCYRTIHGSERGQAVCPLWDPQSGEVYFAVS